MRERGEFADAVHTAWQETRQGRGRLIVVTDPSGFWKSQVINDFVEQMQTASAGSAPIPVVLTARGSRSEQAVALGVLGQLLASPAVSGHRVAAEMLEGLPHVARCGISAAFQARLERLLLGLTSSGLLVAVDDAHLADAETMSCLRGVARRVVSSPFAMIFGDTGRIWRQHRDFHTELVRHPGYRLIARGLMDLADVHDEVSSKLGPAAAERLAEAAYRASGGHPLLVRHLIEDQRSAAALGVTALRVGPATRAAVAAVLAGLERDEAEVLGVLALVQQSGGMGVRSGADEMNRELVAEILGLTSTALERAETSLALLGLLRGTRLRHDGIHAAVLAGIAGFHVRAWHQGAAVALHRRGAPVEVVARHLVAAGLATEAWMVRTLRQAALAATSAGRGHEALGLLRLAASATAAAGDPGTMSDVRLDLMSLEWRYDPVAAGHLLPALIEDLRQGRLAGRGRPAVLQALLWQGRLERIREFVRRPSPESDEARTPDPLAGFWSRLVGRAARPEPGPASARIVTSSEVRAAASIAAVFRQWGLNWRTDELGVVIDADATAAAQRISLDAPCPIAAVIAVLTLLGAGRNQEVELLLDRLRPQARELGPVASTLTDAARALVALRQGDPQGALHLAQACYEELSPAGWGILIGLPLAVLVEAAVQLGRPQAAAAALAVPVPEAMLRTPLGLIYLRARGRYRLRAGRPAQAADDFERVANAAAAGLPLPALLPWRLDLAEARLVLGEVATARQLAEEQLAGPAIAGLRGDANRLLAAAGAPERRVAPLRRAVKELLRNGNELHLLVAHAELARAMEDSGQSWLAAPVRRVVDSHLEANPWIRLDCLMLCPDETPENPAGRCEPQLLEARSDASAPSPPLSQAERKVAELVSLGWKNREIAVQLQVTISTVEQHLTRIYRKLNVSRRSELRDLIGAGVSTAKGPGVPVTDELDTRALQL